MGKNPIRVERPTLTIVAATTPDWFWRAMREVDVYGGLGNRFLYLTGEPGPPVAFPEKPDPALVAQVAEAMRGLDSIPEGTEVFLSRHAKDRWEDFYHRWRALGLDPLTEAATRRIPAHALKLAMAYAALEGTVPTIGDAQLTAAIAVAAYSVECARLLMAQRQQIGAQGRAETAIRKALKGRELPGWKLHQAVGGGFTAQEVDAALRAMLRLGVVEEKAKTHRGRVMYGLA